jgi:hypothetical protein
VVKTTPTEKGEIRMQQFQPGENVNVRLVFKSVVSIKNVFVIFVHQEDENEHLVSGFKARYEAQPIPPTTQAVFNVAPAITKDTKPGVYALDRINFETVNGNTIDYRGDGIMLKFEVVPERVAAPMVEDVSVIDVSIFSEEQWEYMQTIE